MPKYKVTLRISRHEINSDRVVEVTASTTAEAESNAVNAIRASETTDKVQVLSVEEITPKAPKKKGGKK